MELKATRFWWVRHAPVVGADDLPTGGRISGQLDLDCDVSGVPAYALPEDALWFRSHLKRTEQTLEALNGPMSEVIPDLAEQNFGDWQGLTWDDIHALDSTASQDFWAAPTTTAPPNGESFAHVCARVRTAVETLCDSHPGRDLVCVAHAGSIRAALSMALDLTPDQALSFDIANSSLTRLDHVSDPLRVKRGGLWRIAFVNRMEFS